MAIKRRAVALVFAVLLAAGLVSCGDAGSASSEPLEEAVYMVDVQQPFTGYLARDAAELEDIAADAVKLAKDRKAGIAKDAEETDLAAEVNPEFNLANECYADGSYEKAEKLYRSIIDTYPQHYGANVNLTLALLHQEKNEEALVQALSCIELAPGEEGIFLNIQTAGVACGFAAEDLEVAMDATLDGLGRGTYGAGSGYDEEYGPLYRYNKLWSRIETELAVAGDGEDAEAASTDELVEGSFAYDALESELDGGTVENLVLEGEVASASLFAGGIVGHTMNRAVLRNVVSRINLSQIGDGGVAGFGGFVGHVQDGLIEDCIFAGSIHTVGNSTSGVTGWADNLEMHNCAVIADIEVGDLLECYAGARGANVVQDNFYYKTPLSGNAFPATQVTDEQIQSGELCYLLNGDQHRIQWTQLLGQEIHPLPFYRQEAVVLRNDDDTYQNATGIAAVTTDMPRGTVVYDMLGRRVAAEQEGSAVRLPAGIYVINGKKVLIK